MIHRRTRVIAIALVTGAVLALPGALSALSGSGNVTDIVQLGVPSPTVDLLSSTAASGSASGAPVTSTTSYFAVNNSGSNVDTFIRYDWSGTPYYGAPTSQTSITLRGSTHSISDFLSFKQETVNSTGVTVTSGIFSPLVLKNASTIRTATWTSSADACTAWGAAPSGFSPTAAGTLTFRYQAVGALANDAPLASAEYHFCLDDTNDQVYVHTSASYTGATLVVVYTTNSSGGTLRNYQYEFKGAGIANGNHYCLVGVTGSGTANPTPDFAQCQKLPYETPGATTGKLYVLNDPPAYFPSANQGGGITYALAGTQWNPYASSTTVSA